ncbi:MAG: archaeosortase/exosortase family protein [Planctomycetota bacterium]
MMLPRRLAKNGWGVEHLVAVTAMPLLGIAVTWPAWVQIMERAILDLRSRYVLLVPVVAVWLMGVRWVRWRVCRPGTGLPGFLILIGGVVAYIWGDATGQAFLFHLGAVVVVMGLVLAATGPDLARKFMPAWAVLLLLVPLPVSTAAYLGAPLQLSSAALVVEVYRWFGVSVVYDGATLTIGEASIPLSSASKGLSMAALLMLVCYGFVFGLPLRGGVRVSALLLSPILAILCSAVASIATLWVYARFPAWEAEIIQQTGEWVMLLIGFTLLVGLIRLMAWASVPIRVYTLAHDQ